MADDKGGDSGSAWGALEVIIIILLLVGLFDHLFGKTPLGGDLPSQKKEQVSTMPLDDATSRCGLSVSRPRVNEKVGNMVTVSGNAGDCDWQMTEKVALYAQVIDSKGRPVSAYTPIPPRKRYSGDTSFNTTIPLSGAPTGTGYVILVPAVQLKSGQTVSTRVPIAF